MDAREIFFEGFDVGHGYGGDSCCGMLDLPLKTDDQIWDESKAKAEADRRASDLKKLEEPTPGMRVAGEGFCWQFDPATEPGQEGLSASWLELTKPKSEGNILAHNTTTMATLKALVSCGAAYVEGGGDAS